MPRLTKKSLTLFKQIVNISKEDMENYNWAMFTHAMNFFKECAGLKKQFQTSLLNDLSIEDLVTLGNLLSTKFMKPRKHFHATLNM
jgi:hypothetical protein